MRGIKPKFFRSVSVSAMMVLTLLSSFSACLADAFTSPYAFDKSLRDDMVVLADDGRIVFYAEEDHLKPADLIFLRRASLQAMNSYDRLLNSPLSEPIRVYLHDHESYQVASGVRASSGVAHRDEFATDINWESGDWFRVHRAVMHEIAHLYDNASSGFSVRPFFNEGFAEYLRTNIAFNEADEFYQKLRELRDVGFPYSKKELHVKDLLVGHNWFRNDNYLVAGCFVNVLIDFLGIEGFKQLKGSKEGYGTVATLDARLKKLTGKNIETLEAITADRLWVALEEGKADCRSE